VLFSNRLPLSHTWLPYCLDTSDGPYIVLMPTRVSGVPPHKTLAILSRQFAEEACGRHTTSAESKEELTRFNHAAIARKKTGTSRAPWCGHPPRRTCACEMGASVSPNRRRFIRYAIYLCAIAAAASGVFFYANSRRGYTGKMDSIIMAYAPFESTALVWIAEDQRYFIRNGLNITARKYDSGVGALDGMLNGDADLTVGANEFPLVGRAFSKEKIRTIAGMARSEFIYLIGRKDRGIEKVSDLRGKKVGTTFRTIAEFYLGRFLELHGMNKRDMTIVDVKTPAEWVNAIVNGDIDAVATAQPYAKEVKDRLGANATVWSAQSSQPLYTQVISTNEWITKNPEAVRRFLTSLSQAEGYLFNNPAEARAIVRKRLNLDAAYMESVWSQNQFSLSLDESLILAMEDEARWMIRNGLTAEKHVPNFLDYIYEDALKAIRPGAVNIIR
jgi:ABC-type nitrate/sulfonate/bicarbonate transport system substrate-binding protein